MTEENLIVSNFKNIGYTLEASLNTLERTRVILEFFEGSCIDEFDLTPEEKQHLLKGTHKIKESLNYVMDEIEDAENQLFALCSQITAEKNLMYSVVIDSLDQVMKHD